MFEKIEIEGLTQNGMYPIKSFVALENLGIYFIGEDGIARKHFIFSVLSFFVAIAFAIASLILKPIPLLEDNYD